MTQDIASRSTEVPEDDDDADALLSNRLTKARRSWNMMSWRWELELWGSSTRNNWEADNGDCFVPPFPVF
eukprot:scaffold1359_cov183-Skeletonema_marinoi.AAC.8